MFRRYATRRLKKPKNAPAFVKGLMVDEDGVWNHVFAKKKRNDLCQVVLCQNPRAVGVRTCHACRMRRWRANNPAVAALRQVRDRAARKGVPFALTLDDLLEIAGEDYVERVGISNAALQLDRIDPQRGYTRDNIQVLTGRENRRKSDKPYVTPEGCPF